MKLPRFLKKKEFVSKVDPDKWNAMWDLWIDDQVDAPYAQLMYYQSEVSNGGHGQYFSNCEENGDLKKEMAALKTILPVKNRFYLWLAYRAYRSCAKKENAVAELLTLWCDIVVDMDEARLNGILEEYAEKLEV